MRRFTLVLSSLLLVATNVALATVDPTACEELPSVETILQKWAAAMEVDRPRQVHFQRLIYDHVFHREERGTGSFALDAEGHGRVLLMPMGIADVARGSSHDGIRYELEASTPEKWYWTDADIYQLHPTTMTAGHLRRDAKWDIFFFLKNPQSACPLMLGFSADDLQELFDWEIDPTWKRRETEFHLIGRPRAIEMAPHLFGQDPAEVLETRKDFASMKSAEVLIDRMTHETRALRFVDGTGHRETVYVIDRVMDVNGEFWLPDLTGYKNP